MADLEQDECKDELREQAERAASEMFGPWMPAVEEAVRVIDDLRRRWPESDEMQLALVATLDHAARCLDVDRGRSRTRAKGPIRIPSTYLLWKKWRRREEETEAEFAQ